MCCGSGGNTQQQVSTPNIPAWYLDANKNLTTRAEWESNKNYQPYGGPRVAGLNDDQTDAFAMTRANQGAYQPGLSNAYTQTAAAGTAFPSANINAYMSPYQQGVIDIAKNEAVRRDDMARAGRDASAVGAGAFGGSRHALLEAEAGRNLGQNLSDIQMTGSQAAWNQGLAQFNADRQAQLGAGAQYARLGELEHGLGLKDAAALQTIGGQQQEQTQRNYDTAYGDFVEQRGYPQSQLAFLSSILRGNDMSRLYGQTQTTQLPGGSVAGQVAGLGTAAVGAYGLGRGLGWFARGGRVKRRGLGGYAYGGPVRRYQTGGLASGDANSLTRLGNLRQMYQMRGDRAAVAEIDAAIAAMRGTRQKSTGLAQLIVPSGGDESRYENAEFARANAFGNRPGSDRDLEGVRGLAARPASEPLPMPPRSRPAGLAAASIGNPDASAFVDNREDLIAANTGPAFNDGRDDLLVENSTPYHAPAEKKPFDTSPAESLMAAGFRMAEAASRPGAKFAGAVGAGGLEGIRHLQTSRKEARENRELDQREAKDKATIDIANKELALKRQIELYPNSPKVARLQAEIEESKAKIGLIYPAQAEYYRGLAKRAGESEDHLYTIIPGDDGEAIGITRTGKKTPLGVPYQKLKPQMSAEDIRMKALQIVSSAEEKAVVPFTPEERQRRLREAEAYIRGTGEAAPVKRYNPETRKLE